MDPIDPNIDQQYSPLRLKIQRSLRKGIMDHSNPYGDLVAKPKIHS